MAKERQNNSIKDAISAITSAVRAEVNGELDPAQKAATINLAMDVVDNSNLITLAENVDEEIEARHQIDEQIEQEEATAEATAEGVENAQDGDDDTSNTATGEGGDGQKADTAADDAPF